MRLRLGGCCYVGSRGFIIGSIYLFGRRFVLRAAGKFFLSAPFGLLALFFESLHFLLALQEHNGHRVSFKSECKVTISPPLRLGLPARFPRLARGSSR